MASGYQGDSIFWVETDRIKPNPFQPRRVFDEAALASLAESIRQYGVLQPLTVTRKEIERPDEGIFVEYELISGERRLRASKIAGLSAVPVVIRTSEDSDRMKLELAIIENLQREDLNPIDRAEAFQRLAAEFNLKHGEIGQRVGKSREYVSNTLRILGLPEEMREALRRGEINEGHTRPLLMLADKPEEQMTLFKEIILRRLTVRDAEAIARRAAVERVRKQSLLSPDIMYLERQLSERLGTRVRIEKKETGGKLLIDFFSPEDLTAICVALTEQQSMLVDPRTALSRPLVPPEPRFTPIIQRPVPHNQHFAVQAPAAVVETPADAPPAQETQSEAPSAPVEALAPALAEQPEDDDLYSLSNFSV